MISFKDYNIKNRISIGNLNLDASRCGVIGPNGAGKSSLLKSIAGLLDFEGEISIDKNNVAYCGDVNLINSDMLVQEVLFYARGSKAQNHELLDSLIKHFDIGDFLKRSFSSLSGGEKQRVNLVSTFYLESEYTLLDEPTNFLDPIYIDLLGDFLRGFKGHYILVSHDLNFLGHNVDYVIGLNNGIVIFSNTLDIANSEKAFDKVFKKEFIYQEFEGRKFIL